MSAPAIARELIDPDAQKVIRHLTRNGYEAYLVGGCVRDLLLGRTPKDFDVATSATPSEIRDLFRNCRIIGKRFRLAHILFGRKVIETATFRKSPREAGTEGEAGADGGAPGTGTGEGGTGEGGGNPGASGELYIFRDNVFGTAEEDARRRDFTVNGLFYDLETERVIDYVGGLEDLGHRSVRTIGDPNVRFREDPVRMLRAVKFAARLGFDIEDETYRAMITHRFEILKSPPPRVLEEIFRLMKGGAALESLLLLGEIGLLEVMLPELAERLKTAPAALDPYLALLDERVHRGDVPSNAVLLVLLAAPELVPVFDDSSDRLRGATELIDAVLEPLCLRLKVARRDAERAKLLLVAQRHVREGRKRGGKVRASITSRDFFGEAVGLHALCTRVLRAQAGVDEAAIEAELASWPYPGEFSIHAPEAGPRSEGRPSSSDGSGGGPGGPGGSDTSGRRRRRRRRPGEERDDRAERLADELNGGDDHDSEELTPDEDAVFSAFTAALSSRTDDD